MTVYLHAYTQEVSHYDQAANSSAEVVKALAPSQPSTLAKTTAAVTVKHPKSDRRRANIRCRHYTTSLSSPNGITINAVEVCQTSFKVPNDERASKVGHISPFLAT
ncbi:hypothetical protein CHS0354_020638 [Potamilus streckersoni]|uniref:Uncharacterized protein n=1 Tax=Potamilus streckersoni TaxID=2493646 RepID=A0AAE0T2S9_9BIVA|nr:hypothetical protein CHS0354_020638 [Potamilus streckersoni]